MSPEQLLGRGVDQRSDVFSVGVVLWELLTGRPLFLRDNEAATMYAIMNEPLHPPSRYRSDIPPALDDIVMRALARTPADRYDSAEELGMDLERMSTKLPVYDGRTVVRLLEELFGPTRAEAKRAIAQTRSLARNISLVMKLRTEVRADRAEPLDPAASLPAATEPAPPRASEPRRGIAAMIGAVMVLAIAGGVGFVLYGRSERRDANARPVASASLQVDSTPAGAAISIGGEPTGLTTPATLTGVARGPLVLRLELAGHAPLTETVDVPGSGTVTRRFTLAPVP